MPERAGHAFTGPDTEPLDNDARPWATCQSGAVHRADQNRGAPA